MNRQQAGHLLDAYVEADGKVRDTLREVIIDAMMEARYYPVVSNWPSAPQPTQPYKPTITWRCENTPGGEMNVPYRGRGTTEWEVN